MADSQNNTNNNTNNYNSWGGTYAYIPYMRTQRSLDLFNERRAIRAADLEDKIDYRHQVHDLESGYKLEARKEKLDAARDKRHGRTSQNSSGGFYSVPPSNQSAPASLTDHINNQCDSCATMAEKLKREDPEHAAIYDNYQNIHKKYAAKFISETHREDGKPVDRQYVNKTLQDIGNQAAQEMDAKFPMTDPENRKAYQKLYTEINGEGFIASATKMLYDENKGGLQFAKIGGALLTAGGVFTLATSMLGGAAGWAATLAIGAMTIAAAVLGANIASKIFDPAPISTPTGPSQDRSVAQGKAKAVEADGADLKEAQVRNLNNAKAAALQTNAPQFSMSNVEALPTAPALAGIAAKTPPENPLAKTGGASLT